MFSRFTSLDLKRISTACFLSFAMLACITILVAALPASAEVTYEEAAGVVLEDIVRNDLGAVRVFGSGAAYGQGYSIWNFHGHFTDLEETSYFFLIDDYPTANWGHPCRYVWVRESDGHITVEAADSPPTLYEGPRTPPQGAERVQLRELPQSAEAFDPSLSRRTIKSTPTIRGLKDGDDAADEINDLLRSVPPANRWALIVNGGWNQSNNHIRYWGDLSNMYCALIEANGFLEDHIIVCNSDGDSSGVDRSDSTDSPRDLDGDGDEDVDFSGTFNDLTTALSEFYDLTEDDFFFFFATDHGTQTDGGDSCDAELCLWGETTITDDDFATRVANINAAMNVYVFEQCYSGGFVDDLSRENEIVMTAARCSEVSWSGDTFPHFNEFAYEWTAAVRGCYADSDSSQPWQDGTACDADDDDNGHVDMVEAYDYAVSHDDADEHPQYNSNPSYLGDRISLDGPFPKAWIVAKGGTGDFTTIQGAMEATMPGDTIRVEAGTYRENVVMSEGVYLEGEDATAVVIDAEGSGNPIKVDKSGCTITDLTIANSGPNQAGILVMNVGGTIRDNIITQNGGDGITCLYTPDGEPLIERNLIRVCGDNNCGIYTNHCGPTIQNNTIVENDHGVGFFNYSNIRLENNIIYFNDLAGVHCNLSTIISWKNNDVEPSHDDYEQYYGCSPPGLGPSTDIALDPLFVNQVGRDFRIHGGSPCVDAGTETGLDIGAYEFVPSATVGTPGSFTAVSSGVNGELSLSWSTSSGASGYYVYYGSASGAYVGTDAWEGDSPIDVGNVTSYQLTALSTSLTYYLVVTAYDASGDESDPSSEASAQPVDTTPPGHPTAFDAEPGDAVIDLTWNNPTDVDFLRVVVRAKTAGYPTSETDGRLVYRGTASSFTDTAVVIGTQYAYGAFACDENYNYSAAHAAAQDTCTARDMCPPSQPGNFTAHPYDKAIDLTWVKPSEPDFKHLRIRRSTTWYPSHPDSGSMVCDCTGESIWDGGLTNDVTYYYSAFSFDEAGNWAQPAYASATPRDTTPPQWTDGTGIRNAVPGISEVTVYWNSAIDSDHPPVYYNVYYNTSWPATDGTKLTHVTPIVGDGFDWKYVVTGLRNGTEYYFAVRAEDSASPPNEDTNQHSIAAMPEYKTPGIGVNWNLDNLVTNSSGGIENGSGPGKYVMNGTVTISSSDKVTVYQGQELASSDVTGMKELLVEGALVADGTGGTPPLFRSLHKAPGDWGGIHLVWPETGTLIDDCEVEYAETGIHWEGGSPSVTDSYIHNCGGTGMIMEGSPGGSLTAMMNECRQNAGSGISAAIVDSVTAQISDNLLVGNGVSGLNINGFRGSVSMVHDNDCLSNMSFGISCYFQTGGAGDFMDIFENDLLGNDVAGIGVGCAPQDLVIRENRISGNHDGILFIGEGYAWQRPTIQDNDITGNDDDGIDVSQWALPYVFHNLISNNGATGVHSYIWANPELVANTITNNMYGVFCDSSGLASLGNIGDMDPANDGDNRLYGTTLYEGYNDTPSGMKAQNNWWGQSTTTQMSTLPYPSNITAIWDQFDNPVLGFVDYNSWQPNPGSAAPSCSLYTPDWGDSAHLSCLISWTDDDDDDDAVISLYYDDDDMGLDGIIIEGASSISEDDETDEYTWDTSHVPAGEYFVYAIIDDGTSMASSYSPGAVVIGHPDIYVETSTLEISVVPGSSETEYLLVENQGAYDLTFTAEAEDESGEGWDCVTITPSDSVISPFSDLSLAVEVSGVGMDFGTYLGSIVIESNDPDEEVVTVPLQVEATGPEIALSDESHSYGSVAVGDTVQWCFHVYNEGTEGLWVSGVSSDDPDFVIDPPVAGQSVQAGDSLEITVKYQPQVGGSDSAVVTVSSDDFDEPTIEVDLDGMGLDAIILSESSHDFGEVAVCQTDLWNLVIANGDTSDITVTDASVEEMFFDVTTEGFPITIEPGDSTVVTTSFTPLYQSAFAGTLVVLTDSAAESELRLPVSGTGIRPEIGLSETAYHFSGVAVGDSADWELDILALGEDRLVVTSVSGLEPPFEVVSPSFPQTIAGGDSLPVLIRYSPVVEEAADTLFIASDDPFQPTVYVCLSGSYGVPQISLSPDSWLELLFQGDSKDTYLQVANTGSAVLEFSLSAEEEAPLDSDQDKVSEHFSAGGDDASGGYKLSESISAANGFQDDEHGQGTETPGGLRMGSVPWLSFDPQEGTVAPGDTVTVTLTIDGSLLTPAMYYATVQVVSNDPEASLVELPITLAVPTYRYDSHDAGNVVFSVTDGGCYGYWDPALGYRFGSGFQYPVTDPQGYLWHGSFWAGTAADRVSDASCDYDWKVVEGGDLVIVDEPPETGTARYDDRGASSPVGLSVYQESVARGDHPHNDYVTLSYSVTNTSGEDIEGLYLSLYMDWDVNPEWLDEGGYDGDLSLGYQFDSMGADSTHVGISLVEPCPGAPCSFRFIHNPTYSWPMGYIDDADKYMFVSSGTADAATDSAADWSMVMSVGPVSLPAGESTSLTFAVLAGTGLEDLRTNATAARQGLTETPPVHEAGRPSWALLPNYPNPANPVTTIRFGLAERTHARLAIFDVTGRLVRTLVDAELAAGSHDVCWDGSNERGRPVASGVFFCLLRAGEFQKGQKIIVVR